MGIQIGASYGKTNWGKLWENKLGQVIGQIGASYGKTNWGKLWENKLGQVMGKQIGASYGKQIGAIQIGNTILSHLSRRYI